MNPVVDKEKCTGCGNCELLCPAVFQVIDGKSNVIDPEGCDFANCCEAAAENCPEAAITIEKEE